MREPVATRSTSSPEERSTTITSSLPSSVKSLMTSSPDSGNTTGCMLGRTSSRHATSSSSPLVLMPARPPLIESQAIAISCSGTLTGGAMMPPPGVPNGAMVRTSAGSSRPMRMSRCAPGQGAGRRHDSSRPGWVSYRPLGQVRWISRTDSMSPQSITQQAPAERQESHAKPCCPDADR